VGRAHGQFIEFVSLHNRSAQSLGLSRGQCDSPRGMPTLDLIEACYRRADSFDDWARGVVSRVARLHERPVGCGGYLYRLVESGDVDVTRVFCAEGSDLAANPSLGPRGFVQMVNQSPTRDEIVGVTFGAQRSLLLLSDLPARLGLPLRRRLPLDADDSLCMRTPPSSGEGLHVCVLGRRRFQLSDRRRGYLNQLSAHVAAGYQVQRALAVGLLNTDSAVAIASVGGRLMHATGALCAPGATASFLERVKRMDRARCRSGKRSAEEVSDLWQAFVAGAYSLVETFDSDGRRMILAVRTPAGAASGLTPQERRVTGQAARGHGNKAIGDALGLSPSTVGVHLRAALRKLGLRNRQALVVCSRIGEEATHEGAEARSGTARASSGSEHL